MLIYLHKHHKPNPNSDPALSCPHPKMSHPSHLSSHPVIIMQCHSPARTSHNSKPHPTLFPTPWQTLCLITQDPSQVPQILGLLHVRRAKISGQSELLQAAARSLILAMRLGGGGL